MPQRKRKRQRLGESTVPAQRLAAERANHVWTLDFQFGQSADGRLLKLLNVVDEHTREALVMLVDRRIDSDRTVSVLEALVARHGAPELIRCDKGLELTAHAVRDWCRFSGTGSSLIDPGAAVAEPLRGELPRPCARRAPRHRAVLCLAEAHGDRGLARRTTTPSGPTARSATWPVEFAAAAEHRNPLPGGGGGERPPSSATVTWPTPVAVLPALPTAGSC